MHRVVIVEDDEPLREELATLLRNNGYEVVAIDDFAAAAEEIGAAGPDLVLLDLNLPGIDGHFICKSVRKTSTVPIIIVTSRDGDMDELLSMNVGADDFIAKPFNPQVLLAHIGAVLRRFHDEDAADALLTHRGLSLDTARCTVSFGGQTTELTKNELRILGLLMRNAGKVVERQRIQEELWQSDEFVDDNTLSVNVSHLRQKLDAIGARGFIQTKRGIGYLFD